MKKNYVFILLKYIFPNTYRGINKHISPATVGTGCLEFKLPAGSQLGGSGKQPPPPPLAVQKAQLSFFDLERRSAGREEGSLHLFLGKYNKKCVLTQ